MFEEGPIRKLLRQKGLFKTSLFSSPQVEVPYTVCGMRSIEERLLAGLGDHEKWGLVASAKTGAWRFTVLAFGAGRKIIDYDQANIDPRQFGWTTMRRLIEEQPSEIYKVEVYEHITKDGMLCLKKVFEMTKFQFFRGQTR